MEHVEVAREAYLVNNNWCNGCCAPTGRGKDRESIWVRQKSITKGPINRNGAWNHYTQSVEHNCYIHILELGWPLHRLQNLSARKGRGNLNKQTSNYASRWLCQRLNSSSLTSEKFPNGSYKAKCRYKRSNIWIYNIRAAIQRTR